MRTVDEMVISAPVEEVFRLAADVENWPRHLSHYRYVRVRERSPRRTLVEMAAIRPFGRLRWPVWWLSEMAVDPARRLIKYRHVAGVTRGMDVVWQLQEQGRGTRAVVIHEWRDGPAWPMPLWARRAVAEAAVGPVFVKHIVGLTLRGIASVAERRGSASTIRGSETGVGSR